MHLSAGRLHVAASEGQLNVVEFLLGQDIDVNAVDRWGNTPLEDAINNAHFVCPSPRLLKGRKLKLLEPSRCFDNKPAQLLSSLSNIMMFFARVCSLALLCMN
jgi:ankyrin repeat protein